MPFLQTAFLRITQKRHGSPLQVGLQGGYLGLFLRPWTLGISCAAPSGPVPWAQAVQPLLLLPVISPWSCLTSFILPESMLLGLPNRFFSFPIFLP